MTPSIDPHTHEVRYGGVLGRCNSIEGRFMRANLGLSDDQIQAVMLSPIGPIIVGEAPGDSTSEWLPMLPWPSTSAGGRLLRFSGMTAYDYLRTFHRINLMREKPEKWRLAEARMAASVVLLQYVGHPLVLLGAKVQAAFGTERWDAGPNEVHGCQTYNIAHPSGLNTSTNTPVVQDTMRTYLWQAADSWRNPGHVSRPHCATCGQLVRAHDPHPGAAGYRVVCVGETPRIRSVI